MIDDEVLVARAVARILDADFDVTTANDGEEALALLQAPEGYSVVLCDLALPGRSGMELFDQIAEADPDLARRFVFLTGGAFSKSMSDFLARVDNRRLAKPFSPLELREVALEVADDRLPEPDDPPVS